MLSHPNMISFCFIGKRERRNRSVCKIFVLKTLMNQPYSSSIGDKLGKKKGKRSWTDYLFGFLLLILLLKGLGLLKAWFNIDPEGLTLDAGDLATFAGLLYLFNRFDKQLAQVNEKLTELKTKINT